MIKLTMIGATFVLSGCSCLEPNTVRLYAEHVSHATQHMGSDKTEYGYNTVNIELHYQRGGAFLDLAEGLNLNAKSNWEEFGALAGPREVFTARVGYEIPLRR